MNGKLTWKILKWLAGIVLLSALLVYWYWKDSQSLVVLLPNGKAAFYRGSIFHRDKYNLSVNKGTWYFWSKENHDGGDLIVPFECPYNEQRTLRLEPNGKVYVLNKKEMSRYELRVVDNEWSYDASDHWQSIFDLQQ